MNDVIPRYLDLMDSQRESAFAVLEEITDVQLWQRPSPREWSIGEILAHNHLVFGSFLSIVQWLWKWNGWYGQVRRNRPYKTEIQDMYHSPKFPHWVGFLWTPRHSPRRPVSLDLLKSEMRMMHAKVHQFYVGKDEDVLGNLYLYDPWFGWYNLIAAVRIDIYHEQLHYEDVIKQSAQFKK